MATALGALNCAGVHTIVASGVHPTEWAPGIAVARVGVGVGDAPKTVTDRPEKMPAVPAWPARVITSPPLPKVGVMVGVLKRPPVGVVDTVNIAAVGPLGAEGVVFEPPQATINRGKPKRRRAKAQ